MSKIGILTLPFGPNYGMNLQAYALQTVLEEMGYDVVVINRKWNRISSNSGLLASLKRFTYYKIICRRIYSFYINKLHLTKPCYTSEDVSILCKEEKIDYVVIGSDQVWRIENTRGAELDYFGGFMSKGLRTQIISYAASFGNNKWKGTDDETAKIAEYLHNFKSISVREESGVALCKELFGINALCTIDPTLLLDSKKYLVKNNCSKNLPRKLVSYTLDEDDFKRNIIEIAGEKIKAEEYVELYPRHRTSLSIYKYSVEDWLSHISEASFVVTDSFHGMVFSILFNKQFVVVGNEKRGLERFTSLLKRVGLQSRLIKSINDLDNGLMDEKIDYDVVKEKLDDLKKNSLDYLRQNLANQA